MINLNYKKVFIFLLLISFVYSNLFLVSANTYIADIYFTIPNPVYITNERIELKGYLYQTNYTDAGAIVTNSTWVPNATINFTIRNLAGVYSSNYSLTTDSNGTFYSRSNFYSTATLINAPITSGEYYLRAEYTDANNNTKWSSEVIIEVVNQTLDLLSISPGKAKYNPSQNVIVNIEAIRLIGDRILYINNVSVNGSLRNSSKYTIQTLSCTTGSDGKCTTSVTAPSTYGNFILELEDFKAFSSFVVSPFVANVYMKDELGKSSKNIFAVGEQGRIEVSVINTSSADDIYTFSGYIMNSSGSNIKAITSTQLSTNNSFTNTFLITFDALTFNYGAYTAYITISKTGDGSITSTASFEVKDWDLSINKKTSNSGFEYEYSVFPNRTISFEAYPSYRSNGSVIPGINSSFFTISIQDDLNNIFSSANVTWNASCGKEGCYEFSLTSPVTAGKYYLYTIFSYQGALQTKIQVINVISGVMAAQSTDKDGNIKELFGTNEYAYITLTTYNLTSAQINLTEAEIFLVSYINGTQFSYIQVNNFSAVNMSNSNYEWAWNSTSQRIKLDVPKIGGVHNVFLFGNNRTLGAITKFIVNPYDACMVPKDTPGNVSSGYYYIWQFKTSDTIYFEIKLIQANNPLGKASSENLTGNASTYGMGFECSVDTTTKQVVNNATISVVEVKSLESGAVQNINVSASTCQSSDNSGSYTCTVKPSSKWDGGVNIVKFNIAGQDGTTSVAYSRFESRAFYLYGWSTSWQNNPSSNITLNVRLYEAGSGWWSSYGSSGGLSGTITLKKIEYQGRDGEWLWPPVNYAYNVSNVSSSSVTSGTGTISMPYSLAPGGSWKTGYYRAIIQGTTSNGDTDYGYAWFGIKLWDVYGYPIECSATSCNYKSYFNSKENISLYISISKAGDNWWYWSYSGSQDIGGNVTVGVKKIQDCGSWPCKELNSTQYSASTINVNQSSPGYWNANTNQSNYIIQINKTSGSWGTGYYSVTLDVNGTDTGSAWFNTIAFYVETQPTNNNGSAYKYSIRGNNPMYFNITTTKSYKWAYSGARYNTSDYVNTTIDDATLRTWDYNTYKSRELHYPEDFNITPSSVNGTGLINITYNNVTWPTGYYWGELAMKNSENETSNGWLWFNVQPFRVNVGSNTYSVDSDQCINATINIYDPDWYSNSPLYGNYSITSIYENIWSGYSQSQTFYSNYTPSNISWFNATGNLTVCPGNGDWGGGSWGGYHYLNVVVRDNAVTDTQTGWLSFRAVPFQISWTGGGGNKLTNQHVNVSVSLTKPTSGANATGNITRVYQWRYDNYVSRMQEYNFSVGNCFSNVSGQCTVNGTGNLTVYAPADGWRVGYNYLQTVWTKQDNALSVVSDYSGIYFDGRTGYNGYFSNSDLNNGWKYDFRGDENITIKLYVRDYNYNSVDVNITDVQYASSGTSCWDEWCRSYGSATYTPSLTSSGSVILNIRAPANNWTRGIYYIKASVSGSAGANVWITGGNVRVKDMIAPNITMISPVNNVTYNSTLLINLTTSENAQCWLTIVNYDNFNNWYCYGWNSTNGTNMSTQSFEACNATKYGYNGSNYYYEWISNNYRSTYNGSYSNWASGTYLMTGGTSHYYTIDVSNYTTQYYGANAWCYDDDWNYVSALAAFRINGTTLSNARVLISNPSNNSYLNANSITFNFTANFNTSCVYSLDSSATNYTTSTTDNRNFNATNSSIADKNYKVYVFCNESSLNGTPSGNIAYNHSNFTIDATKPLIDFASGTPANNANLTQNWLYVNTSITETNYANTTFKLYNSTSLVNLTTTSPSSLIYLVSYSINWTNLAYNKTYTYNITITDKAGNSNTTATRTVNLSSS